MKLDDIYTEVITQNSAARHNRRRLEHPTARAEGSNPSCGDEIALEFDVQDGQIADAAFTGTGCAISQASASMMLDLVKGKTVQEARALAELFTGMIRGTVTDERALEPLEDAAALQGVARLPARVKCAAMPWHTLERTLSGDKKQD